MRKIYTLLTCTLFYISTIQAQTLYTTTEGGSSFNLGVNSNGTPRIMFDDINIASSTISDADSIGFTNIKVGIRRFVGAPAVTVKVYLTSQDPSSFGLDSLPSIPPTLIGTFNLAAFTGAANATQILSIGDSINVFKTLARDTGNFFTNYQTAYVGVSFSSESPLNRWRTATNSVNFDAGWMYNSDSTSPRTAFGFGATLYARFLTQAYGKPIYAPLAFDARVTDIITPAKISCYNGPQTISVEVTNNGTNTIAAGAAAVTLKVRGANTYARTINNTTAIPSNGTQLISFTDVNLPTAGDNLDTAIVNLVTDLRRTNDTLSTNNTTAKTINTFPAVEDVEGALPVFSYIDLLAGTRQLWRIVTTPPRYKNVDLTDSLGANTGNSFFLYDSYSGASSVGNVVRLYSNCVNIGTGATCDANIRFFMSHDNSFSTDLDSLYVTVTTDRGATWNRITGYGRFDAGFPQPGWMEHQVDLNAYKGQTIQIGFEGVSKYGNVMGLDDITINSNCITPVNLTSFTAEKVAKNNKLTWKTSQETNTATFDIQQSKNGRDFVSIGQIAAAGNSNVEKTYTYTHINPSKGFNYYRIKTIDRDNAFKISVVRNVQNIGINQINCYPNPVKNSLTVNINTEKTDVATVQISDINGKIVYTKTVALLEGNNNITVATGNFTAGNYIVKVQLSNEVIVQKLSKL
jgi:Secretion system C-terminal sorting domain